MASASASSGHRGSSGSSLCKARNMRSQPTATPATGPDRNLHSLTSEASPSARGPQDTSISRPSTAKTKPSRAPVRGRVLACPVRDWGGGALFLPPRLGSRAALLLKLGLPSSRATPPAHGALTRALFVPGTDTTRGSLFRRRALSPRMVTVSPCRSVPEACL